MHDDATDAELVRAIAAGGEATRSAEAQLCQRFGSRIRLYGLRHLRDADLARDLVQSVLLAVLEAARAGRIQEPHLVDRFVLGVCRNTSLRMRQNAKRTSAVSEDDLVAMNVTTFETVELGGLIRCFSELEQRAQHVVRMSFQEDASAEDIAQSLSTSAGNVRVVRHRALAALRECLDRRTTRQKP